MSRDAYYEELKDLARKKRIVHRVDTTAFGLREVRKIYIAEGIRIDKWPLNYKIKALYMCADGDCSVAVQQKLPDEPKLFALIHELKHHYVDQEKLGNGALPCCDYNANELIEKGAEVFAAEFIYPEAESLLDIKRLGIETWQPESVVEYKRSIKAKVSYQFLCKRLERLRMIAPKQFAAVKFQRLEESIYGPPFRRQRAN
jgi:Zn-dependent peptidase ImmA (M78 family)